MSEDDAPSAKTDTPPLRFAIVEDHPPLYRGSYPLPKNLHFLRRLRLKTILSITPEPLGEEVAQWCSAQGVRMIHLTTTKEKSKKHPVAYWETKQALQVMINRVHQPLYVHCLNGAEVTSLVIACLRKLQCWSVSSTMAEFGRYCLVRPAHTSFIETFHVEIEITKSCPRWLFRGVGPLGKEGIIADHPTLKVRYTDPDMAKAALELKAALEEERKQEKSEQETGQATAIQKEIEEIRSHVERRHDAEHSQMSVAT